MGDAYLNDPISFLVKTFVDLYVIVLFLRFMLQAVGAPRYNPVSQFAVQVTDPVLQPIRRVIPPVGGQDTASLVFIVLIEAIAIALAVAFKGVAVPPGSLLVLTLAEVIRVVLDFFFFTILAQAILSWVAAASQSYDNPAFEILGTINEPILAPVRSLIPPISGIDLSPLFALIALQVLKRLLLPPLLGLA